MNTRSCATQLYYSRKMEADAASERDRRAVATQLAVGVVAATGVAAVVAAALRASGVLSQRKKKKKKDDGVASLDVDNFIVRVVEGQIKSNVKHVGKSVVAPFLIASLAAAIGCVRRARRVVRPPPRAAAFRVRLPRSPHATPHSRSPARPPPPAALREQRARRTIFARVEATKKVMAHPVVLAQPQ